MNYLKYIGGGFKQFPEILKIAKEAGFIPEQRFDLLRQEMEVISRKSYAHVPMPSKDMSPEVVKEDAYSSIKIATEFLELLVNTWETYKNN